MDAVDQRYLGALQRFGGGDIGEDHELLDQPVGIEPLRRHHAIDRVVRGEHDLAFRDVEIEGRALVSRALERTICGIERLQDGAEQGTGRVVGPAVDRGLRLLIGKLGGGTDQHAVERVDTLAAVGADHHSHRDRGAILVRAQRAQLVGDALWQHRHHPIREIDRIAADARLAVERRAGPHIVGYVRNRDADDMAAGVFRVDIRLGVNGVVVVLRVGGIDGDEGYLAPVLAGA